MPSPPIKYPQIKRQKLKICVYALTCPIENKIKYVGCTSDLKKRYGVHLSNAFGRFYESKKKLSWLHMLINKNLFPGCIIINEFDDMESAIQFEQLIINNIPSLTNCRNHKYKNHFSQKIINDK
jgi:predicted GIY-YIG superfamily endonuclease